MPATQDAPIRLIAIDDDPHSLELVSAALEGLDDLEIFTTTNPVEGIEIVRRKRPDIILLDLMMPELNGMDVLEQLVEIRATAEVILMTAHYSTESAVQAIQKGASDYLNKPLQIDKLRKRIQTLSDNARKARRAWRLDSELLQAYCFEGMVGRSPLMLEVFAQIARIAPHYRTLLVTGPTGTGKELVARAIHRLSPYARGPFVVCNCSAVVESLFESELFGHVRGAFTGAAQDKMGLIEHASGGTLFLDEIGEMPLAVQPKLLRVLQNREVQRVGSPIVRHSDVRIIAATHRDLRLMASTKEFREDLYYRLSMMDIRLPALAQRKEDLPLLERHLIEQFSQQYQRPVRALTRRAQAVLASYHWPGNVRELENVLGRACMMSDGEMIDVRDLPNLSATPLIENGLVTLDMAQRRHAKYVLEHVGGNKVKAAEILGVSRTTLYRLLDDLAAAHTVSPL